MPDLASGLGYYVVFLLSTTMHEAAHALAAKLGGDPTAYHGGQVTLDPRPHIQREPFGMVVLPILSVLVSGWPFGFASAPYDPRWALRHPRRAAWMALAGPAANMLLVMVAFVLIRAGVFAGVFDSPESASFGRIVDSADLTDAWRGVTFVLSATFSMNLALALLNLIPMPPLDGSTGVAALLPESTATGYIEWLHNNQTLGMIGMLVAWRVFDMIFDPVFVTALNLLHPGASYG
jgi:Zn-dependent protease